MSEPAHNHDILNDLRPQHRALKQEIPDVYRAFNELGAAAMAEGALPTRVKELMAMIIGVVHGCDGCIASHARGAARAGATTTEAAEAIGVAIMMHGGPATVYGARAYAAFVEFVGAAPSN